MPCAYCRACFCDEDKDHLGYSIKCMQAASEAQARLQGHEQRMTDLQKELDSAQRLMRSAQSQARDAADEKASLMDKVCAVLCCACAIVTFDLLSMWLSS